jgi:acetate kinase
VGVTAVPDTVATVLCMNAGSSSLKAARFRADDGVVERRSLPLTGAEELSAVVDEAVDGLIGDGLRPDVIGHRVVHGGPDFAGPVKIDDAVVARLCELVPLAPLHQPAAIAVIEQLRDRMPDVPHVACFDTAFHRRLPESAQRLPLPARYWAAGVRRYGFHGLSYEYVVGRLGDELGARSVIAHLGSGASLVALRDGSPVDTTMSLTPGGGVVMATRSGDLDPGVVLHLLRLEGRPEDVAVILERESGLLGISGRTGDMRALLAASPHDDRAREAVTAFVTSVAKHIAALTTVLGGLDTLVFTAGIGAGSADIRAAVAERIHHLGVELSEADNERGGERISAPDAACTVLAVPTDEEAVVGAQALRLMELGPGGPGAL